MRDIPLVFGPESVNSAECFTHKPVSIHTPLSLGARSFHSAHPPGKKSCPHFTDEETETRRVKGPTQGMQLWSGKGDSKPGVPAAARCPPAPAHDPIQVAPGSPVPPQTVEEEQQRADPGSSALGPEPPDWACGVHTRPRIRPLYRGDFTIVHTHLPDALSGGRGSWDLGLLHLAQHSARGPTGAQVRPQKPEFVIRNP